MQPLNLDFLVACQTYFYMMRCVAASATTSHMEYQVFRHVDANRRRIQLHRFYVQESVGGRQGSVQCSKKNTLRGLREWQAASQDGERLALHPRHGQTPCETHFDEEQKLGHQIWPARQKLDQLAAVDEDDDFCNKLACTEGAVGVAW